MIQKTTGVGDEKDSMQTEGSRRDCQHDDTEDFKNESDHK